MEDAIERKREMSQAPFFGYGTTGNARKMIFGKDAGADDLAGGDKDDHLYGMGGDDTCIFTSGDARQKGSINRMPRSTGKNTQKRNPAANHAPWRQTA